MTPSRLFAWLVRLQAPPSRAFAGEMVRFMEARHARAVEEGRRLRFWLALGIDMGLSIPGGWLEYLGRGGWTMGGREWLWIVRRESGLRFLRRRKAAGAMAVTTVALALGANNIAFAVLDAFLLSSFGIPDADRVVAVVPSREVAGQGRVPFNDAYPNYRLLRETARSFESVAAMTQATVSWDDGEQWRALSASRVTASFFATTGVAPILGREIALEEEGPSPAAVVVISHALWQGAFAGDPQVIGRSLSLDGVATEVVGVMPPGFARPLPSDVWLPFDLQAGHWDRILAARSIIVYGRLAADASLREAETEMRDFTTRALEASRDNEGFTYGVLRLRQQELPQGERAVLLVQAGSLLLLLLAVLNLAVVLIAWGLERRQEMSIRLALGAGSGRITAGLLFQGLAVVLAASIGGLAIATFSLPALRGLDVPPALAPYLALVDMDASVLSFGVAVALVAGLAAAAVPAWLGRRMTIGDSLRAGPRNAGLTPTAVRMQRAMLSTQAAFAVILLAGAASLGLSFRNLGLVATGFESKGRLVTRIQLPTADYASHEERAAFGSRVEEALRLQPEIARAGFTTNLPMGDGNTVARFVATPEEADPALDPPASNVRRISTEYLDVMGIPLLEGRAFGPGDDVTSHPVAIVSRSVADRLWPGLDAVGRSLYRALPGSEPLRIEVVGVAGDLVEIGFDRPPGHTVYLPWAQSSGARLSFVFEPRTEAGDAQAAFARALQGSAPGVATGPVVSMVSIERQANLLPWLQSTLVSAFATLALAIALLGTYGVMSQLVASRQRDHAVRMAMGARPAGIAGSVVRSAATVAVPGVLAGVALSWLTFDTFLGPALFGVGPGVSRLWLGVGAVMLLMIVVATLPPAVRAARVRVGAGVGTS